jgi:hypothetical protein
LPGFVVYSFVRDGSDGCGVVGVRVWVGCCRLCAGWCPFRGSSDGQLLDDVFNMSIQLYG